MIAAPEYITIDKKATIVSGHYFLKTGRIGFRTWTLDDIELAIDLWGDPDVARYIGGPFSNSQVQRKLSTERAILRLYNIQYWPIFDLFTGEHIGCCGLRPYKSEDKVYEIESHIKKAFWGKGYGRESAKAVIDYAKKQIGAKAIYASHNPASARSKSLLEKLGFQYTHDAIYEPTGVSHASYLLNFAG
jgi:[ribosomal protein S5]-alanine N-acetyltransferase